MDIQSIWESIELDKRQLKCLIDAFKSEPDAELQSLLKRNAEQLQARLIQLVEAVDATMLHTEVIEPVAAPAAEPSAVTAPTLSEQPQPEVHQPAAPVEVEITSVEAETKPIEVETELVEAEIEPVAPMKEPEAFIMDEDDYLSHEIPEPILGERVVIEKGSANIPLSLNDLFRFSREWFDGDTAKFNSMWSVFASIDNYDDAEAYLHTCINSSDEDETMADCLALLKRFYQA